MTYDSIPKRVQTNGTQLGDSPAYFVRGATDWEPTSWADYAAEIRVAGRALIALGHKVGTCVSILGFNRPEWIVFDVAAMSVGGVPAGIYTTCSPEEVQYIVSHSESSVVLVENKGQWEKVKAQRENLPLVTHVVTMKGAEPIDDDMVLSWDEFLALGTPEHDAAFDARLDALGKDDLATLIYTSGTTGPPKGVMLSHDNLAWTAGLAVDLIGGTPSDRMVSYLPLSHIAEQMFTIHAATTIGYSVYFARSLDDLGDHLAEVHPTAFFAVPRVWEKMHAKIAMKLGAATGVKASLARWAQGVGYAVNTHRFNTNSEPSGFMAMKYAIANKLIFSKIKAAIGLDQCRLSISGAAPIGEDVIDFFLGFDVPIREIYGQSEDSGPTTFNQVGKTRVGSVGARLDGIEVETGDDGEIKVRGRNVFMGYFKNPEATAETLQDGWLLSGDLGAFDDDGFLFITGRKKEIIITAGGKNIAPKNLEAALKAHDLINEAVVIGDRRKYLVALVTLDPETSEAKAAELGITVEQLHDHPTVVAELNAHREEANQEFARVEQIKKIAILERNFLIDEKELTPTLKVKRKFVHENWADTIEALYADAEEAS